MDKQRKSRFFSEIKEFRSSSTKAKKQYFINEYLLSPVSSVVIITVINDKHWIQRLFCLVCGYIEKKASHENTISIQE